MSKTSALIGLLALVGVIAAIVVTPANYEPCASEDSTWCVWDGQEQGNGTGNTVINFWADAYIVL